MSEGYGVMLDLLVRSMLNNLHKNNQSQNPNDSLFDQRQVRAFNSEAFFSNQSNISHLTSTPIGDSNYDEVATRNLASTNSINNNSSIDQDTSRAQNSDQTRSIDWLELLALAQTLSSQQNNTTTNHHHQQHNHLQHQQNQLKAQHFLHANLNPLNYMSLPNSSTILNQSNGCSSHNPFSQISSNPYLDCPSNSVSNLSSPVPTTSPIVYNTTTANSTNTRANKRHNSSSVSASDNDCNSRKRPNVFPLPDMSLVDLRTSPGASIFDLASGGKFIANNNLNHFQSTNGNNFPINNLHQSQHLLSHLQASLTSSSCSSSSLLSNNFMDANVSDNNSIQSNIVNNYNSTNINITNNNNNNNNVTINNVETCNSQAAIVAHQPSVPTSSFLAKLTAVTSRPNDHTNTICLDDKNVVDLLEAFYVISDQPDPAAIEMISKAIKTTPDVVANWYDDKRAKLNGLSNASRENNSSGDYDVVDAAGDFMNSTSVTGRSLESNGNANICNANRKRAGGRVVTFSEYQRSLLETIFDDNNYLHPQEYEVLSNLIEVPARNIKIWFKNRRSKQRLSGRTTGA